MDLMIDSLADRPDLAPIFDLFPDSWAEFLYHDPVTEQLFDRLVALHPESNLIAIDRDAPEMPVARACAFPFRWAGDPDVELPPGGYDRVLLDGFTDDPRGSIAAALEITIRPDMRGSGLSRTMLDALRATLRGLGYTSLVAPVRPNEKHRWPHESMATYSDAFSAGRVAAGSVAAYARAGGGAGGRRRAVLDDGPGHADRVARVDRTAVRQEWSGAGAAGPGAGVLRHGARGRHVRRAERVDAPSSLIRSGRRRHFGRRPGRRARRGRRRGCGVAAGRGGTAAQSGLPGARPAISAAQSCLRWSFVAPTVRQFRRSWTLGLPHR